MEPYRRHYPRDHESPKRDPHVYRHRRQSDRLRQHGDAAAYESHCIRRQHRYRRSFADEHSDRGSFDRGSSKRKSFADEHSDRGSSKRKSFADEHSDRRSFDRGSFDSRSFADEHGDAAAYESHGIHQEHPGSFADEHGDAAVYESQGIHHEHARSFADEHNDFVLEWVQSANPPSPVRDRPVSIPASRSSVRSPVVEVADRPRERDRKLVEDPFPGRPTTEVHRYDGVVPIDSLCPEPVDGVPRTYRSKSTTMKLPIVLPVPQFKVDKNYIGLRPEVEVTIYNLNDDVDNKILTDLVSKFGKLELLQIYYHPITKSHLGLAKIIFEEAIAAKNCVLWLNNTSVMGKFVKVFLDPFAKKCNSIFLKMTEEKPQLPELPEEEPLAESQTEENAIHLTNYNFDSTNPTSTTTDLQSDQSYGSGYYSMNGAPGYNGPYPCPNNRYHCNVSPVTTNHSSGESNFAPPLLHSMPSLSAPVPRSKLDSKTNVKLDLDTRIKELLSGKSANGASIEPAFLSVLNNDSDNEPETK